MAAPVWVLSVDLQTKTATFQSGMADAAKSARGAFTDIKSGSGEMGREVGGNMMEARHGVMMLGEEFGVHLPRGLTTFIASIGPVGAAMEAAFPFLAIALGATLLLEHLAKIHEAGEKLTEDQMKFGTAAQNAFNSLDEKIDQAKIKADELRGDHLGALKMQLDLIDRQSMAELVHSFGEVAKAADTVFDDLKSHWYTFGIGAEGAKHALTGFKAEYESLLAQGKDKEASDLLAGTRASAEKILEMQKQAADSFPKISAHGTDHSAQLAFGQANNALKAAGVGYTEKEVAAQKQLVDALNAQVGIEQRVAELKKLDGGNAKTAAHKAAGKDDGAAARKAAEEMARVQEIELRDLEEAGREMVTQVQQFEKERIAATREGSAARLAAIDSALHDEQNRMMQDTAGYRELLTERVALVRQMGEQETEAKAEADRESIAHGLAMGELELAAQKEQAALVDSFKHVSTAARLAEEMQAADAEYALKLAALQKEIAALDEYGNDYNNKLQALLDKETQMYREHEQGKTDLQDKAAMERNAKLKTLGQQLVNDTNTQLTQALMGHESFAKMMSSIGNQIAQTMIQNELQRIEANLMSKESDAANAARKAFNIGLGIGGPAGMVLGPLFAAGAFAAVMAFEKGGIVPGVGRGDIVPAMLEPGEGVLPKGLMDRLSTSPAGSSGGSTIHVHHSPTYHVQTIDGDGIRGVLQEHSDEFSRHMQSELRRMNR